VQWRDYQGLWPGCGSMMEHQVSRTSD
jgi:hypothetical protein